MKHNSARIGTLPRASSGRLDYGGGSHSRRGPDLYLAAADFRGESTAVRKR